MDSLKLNPVQKAAFSLIQQDLRYIYTVIKNINPKASNYIPSMLPYLGVVIDGAEDWLKAIKNSSKCKFCMPLFNESQTIFYEQIRNSIKMWQQDYNEIYISLGNAYRKNDDYFGSVIEQINQKLGIALKINSKWKSDRFRNSMAHYKLGIVLKESNLIISDAMFGLTEKIFGEDYYTIKKSIYKELEKLAKQIGAYLDLPQRMVYLQ